MIITVSRLLPNPTLIYGWQWQRRYKPSQDSKPSRPNRQRSYLTSTVRKNTDPAKRQETKTQITTTKGIRVSDHLFANRLPAIYGHVTHLECVSEGARLHLGELLKAKVVEPVG